MEFYNVS